MIVISDNKLDEIHAVVRALSLSVVVFQGKTMKSEQQQIAQQHHRKALIITSKPEVFATFTDADIVSTSAEANALIAGKTYDYIFADAAITTDNSSAFRICRTLRRSNNETPFYEMRTDISNLSDKVIRQFGGNGVVLADLNSVIATIRQFDKAYRPQIVKAEPKRPAQPKDLRQVTTDHINTVIAHCSKIIGPAASILVDDAINFLEQQKGSDYNLDDLLRRVTLEIPENKKQFFLSTVSGALK